MSAPHFPRLSEAVSHCLAVANEQLQRNKEAWEDIVQTAEDEGDGLDYDGPLTWA